MNTGDFLKFKDGDVIVSITGTKSYQLHAATLRRNSALFNSLLAEEYGADLQPRAKKDGITVRYRLELGRADLDGIGTFERTVSASIPIIVIVWTNHNVFTACRRFRTFSGHLNKSYQRLRRWQTLCRALQVLGDAFFNVL